MVHVEKQIAYWREGAKEDFSAARDLIDRKHYKHGLFFVHLAIEKLFKALVTRETQSVPPKIHDLIRLAKLAKIELDSEQVEKAPPDTRVSTGRPLSGHDR